MDHRQAMTDAEPPVALKRAAGIDMRSLAELVAKMKATERTGKALKAEHRRAAEIARRLHPEQRF